VQTPGRQPCRATLRQPRPIRAHTPAFAPARAAHPQKTA
jgi:hypothetical protein